MGRRQVCNGNCDKRVSEMRILYVENQYFKDIKECIEIDSKGAMEGGRKYYL